MLLDSSWLRRATILKVDHSEEDEFNNAAYFFYKVEKDETEPESNSKQKSSLRDKKHMLRLSDTVYVDMSENALLPDQTVENTAPLFRNYTQRFPDIPDDVEIKETKPSVTLEKWRVAKKTELEKTRPGFYSNRSVPRRRPSPAVQQTDYTLPLKPSLSKESFVNDSLGRLPGDEIRVEEAGVTRTHFTKKKVPTFNIAPAASKGFKGIMMPVLEPFFPDPHIYKKISLAQLQKKSGSNTASRQTLTGHLTKGRVALSSRDSLVHVPSTVDI